MGARKGQAWILDFIVGFVLFLIVLLLTTTVLFDHFEETGFSDAEESAYIISESLLGPGYPKNWTNETVIRIGLTSENRLDLQKLSSFSNLTYGDSLSYFGVKNDYVVFFERNGTVQNLTGLECGYGKVEVLQNCAINLNNIDYDNLAKVNRLIILNSTILELVVYTW